jgi:hypothetical protein
VVPEVVVDVRPRVQRRAALVRRVREIPEEAVLMELLNPIRVAVAAERERPDRREASPQAVGGAMGGKFPSRDLMFITEAAVVDRVTATPAPR